jgi:hypothetical protein
MTTFVSQMLQRKSHKKSRNRSSNEMTDSHGNRRRGRMSHFLETIQKTFRCRSLPTEHVLDATTARFFHGDLDDPIDNKVFTSRPYFRATSSIYKHTVLSSKSTVSWSESSSDSSTGSAGSSDDEGCTSLGEENIIYSYGPSPRTTCCVDDYLPHSTDGDTFMDRYAMLVRSFRCKNAIGSLTD